MCVALGSFTHTDRGFPLGTQHELFPGGSHFPGALIHSHHARGGRFGLPHPRPQQPALLAAGRRWSPPPVTAQRLPQPGSQRAGARQLLGKPQAKLPRSHREVFFFFFFKESSDVTVWWQESYPVSSSSSHHSPPLRTCCPAAESTVCTM